MNFLQLWQEIYQEAIHLCDAIDSLPDHCDQLREHFNQLNLSLVADRVAEPPETVEEL